MKVTEAMSPDRFEAVLDAGAELLDALRGIMRSYGLAEEDAPAVVCVAASGALSCSPVPQKNFGEMIDMTSRMWKREGDGSLADLEFNPPHRQDVPRPVSPESN